MIVPLSWKCLRKIADPFREIDGSLVHIQLFKHEAHSVCTRPSMTIAARRQIRRIGYTKDEMTGHGFRSMASTLLHEQGWNHQAIERQLGHGERNAVSAAYDFAEHLPVLRRRCRVGRGQGPARGPIHRRAVDLRRPDGDREKAFSVSNHAPACRTHPTESVRPRRELNRAA